MIEPPMLTVVVFGASGDLARRKTFPALFSLFRRGLLHQHAEDFKIIGYARSHLSLPDFHAKLKEFLNRYVGDKPEELETFLKHCEYQQGDYDSDKDFSALEKRIESFEGTGAAGEIRIFYLALPPSIFLSVAGSVRKHLCPAQVTVRLVVEKPFGRDSESSRRLSAALSPLFSEAEIYRIDHYLGKEMVKNVLILRFANIFFNAVWNRMHIKNVQIVFKETIGVEGRGGYFDEFGIIRDVMQNHLLQMLAIVAMDRPASLSAEDIRNEKVKVLRSIKPIQREDLIIGQYGRSEDGLRPGYNDDETVPSASITPTFAMATMYVRNERWDGVPFILRCGKALNEQKAEIRIQFQDVPGSLFGECTELLEDSPSPRASPIQSLPCELARNELVLRVQPNEAVYLKLMVKRPGHGMRPLLSDLDLSYSARYSQMHIPDAYESLILDILRGEQANFVRDDELTEAWRIFTPVLHEIERNHIQPEVYPAGSRGPQSADDRLLHLGYRRSQHHTQQYS